MCDVDWEVTAPWFSLNCLPLNQCQIASNVFFWLSQGLGEGGTNNTQVIASQLQMDNQKAILKDELNIWKASYHLAYSP